MDGTALRMRAVASMLALLLAGAPVHAQRAAPLPAEQQVTLLTRILSFDRTLRGQAQVIEILVLYQADYAESVQATALFMRAARRLEQAHGMEIRFRDVAIKDEADCEVLFDVANAEVAYIMPMRDIDVSGLADAAAKAGVRTFSGIAGYVNEGISVTLGEDDGRPAIYVNLRASRKQGSDYSSQLLKLARVVE